MHWKIRRDPYLSRLAEKHGEEAVYQAGFFLDEDKEDATLDDVALRCTPVPRRRSSSAKRIVLLSTGGFNPVHGGHIEMMCIAREAATRAGFDVVGGYLSPGHDAYLSLKCGAGASPASVRLAQCAAIIASDPRAREWLSVDPWESLHRRVSVNYTDVAARLRAYLRHHYDPDIDVFYVCGGDNARFAYAFAEDGGCVVIGRPGAEGEGKAWRERLASHERIVFAEGNNPSASRAMRPAVWVDERKRKLVLRIEDMRALTTLCESQLRNQANDGSNGKINAAWLNAFQDGIVRLLGQHVSVRTAPLMKLEGEPTRAFTFARAGTAESLEDSLPSTSALAGTISLDALIPGEHNITVSRLYELGGYSAIAHVERPGTPSLADQIARIPPGEYVLRDDDSVTGSTIAAVKKLLPPHVIIKRTEMAIPHDDEEDVVDGRDFILGADDGGLVIALGKDVNDASEEHGRGRAPYILPYVDPSARASIRPQRIAQFSQSIWSLNERMFRETDLRVRDLPPPARATFRFLGEDTLLHEVCAWHLRHLASVA